MLSINQLMALLAFIVLYLACWVQAGQHGTVENSTAATLFALEVRPKAGVTSLTAEFASMATHSLHGQNWQKHCS